MSNSIAPGSSADVNVKVTALSTNPNVPVTYKTIILKKNLVNGVNTLTQEMMSTTNTKYVIKYDYVLGENITVPENCILEFDGGSIDGGTIIFNNTVIIGCPYCLGLNLNINGSHSEIDLAWLGIVGNNPDNATLLSSLSRIERTYINNGRDFYLSDDIKFTSGDIVLPNNVNIRGNNHIFIFDVSTVQDALICLGQENKLNDLKIQVTNSSFTGTCLLFDSQIANGGQFELSNINIQGKFYSDYNLTTGCGFKVVANNNGDNRAAISMCHIKNITIQYTKVGIEVICDNSIVRSDNRFAWMNEVYFDNVFITSKESAIKTTLLDNTTTPTTTTGKIWFSHVSSQAIGDTPLFTHKGNWTINIVDGWHYDSSILGRVFDGIVNLRNIGIDIRNDSDGEDEYGTYTMLLGVRRYGAGKITNNEFNIATMSSFVDSTGYNGSTGEQRFMVGSEENAFTVKRPQNKAIKWFNNITSNENIFGIYDYSNTLFYIERLDLYLNKIEYILQRAIDNANQYYIKEIRRYTNTIQIVDSSRTTEVYDCILASHDNIPVNTVFKMKVKLNFKNNGTDITWVQYKSLFDRINITRCFNRVYVKDSNVLKKYYKEESNELYLYVVAQSYYEISNYLQCFFNVYYNNSLSVGTDITIADNGEPTLIRTADDYMYSCSMEIVSLDNNDKGICRFTGSKPEWWNGSAWVDATGATV